MSFLYDFSPFITPENGNVRWSYPTISRLKWASTHLQIAQTKDSLEMLFGFGLPQYKEGVKKDVHWSLQPDKYNLFGLRSP